MTSHVNRHGLSRSIPERVKREVRKACGFGCVCCGIAIAAYEHIDPEFHDATEHNAQNMAYLCEGCHSKVTRRFWSKSKIKEARQAPHCVRTGRCNDAFDFAGKELVIWIGGNRIINIATILRVDDKPLLSIEPPECEQGPYRLSGEFYDDQDNLLFSIDRNEWQGESSSWDIEAVGGTITVRQGHGAVALQITCHPPQGIVIDRLNMYHGNTRFQADKDQLIVTGFNSSKIIVGSRELRAIGGVSGTAFSGVSNGGLYIGPGDFTMGPLPKDASMPARRTDLGRNDKCFCGSQIKFKRCHGR
jgi:hypothetical protein